MLSYDLLICDCDGVLVDSEPLAARAMLALLNVTGTAATEAMFAECIGMKQADILAHLAARTGSPIDPGVPDRLWPETRELFSRDLTEVEGAREALAAIVAPRCVASSSHLERIRFSLDVTGLADLFGEAVFSSQMVRRGKPAPDLFLYAAERMGADPARCVVVEDSVPGVTGAVAAGMTAIGFIGGSHLDERHRAALTGAGAAHVAADWRDVARLLGTDAAA